jgi:hypothetical protein
MRTSSILVGGALAMALTAGTPVAAQQGTVVATSGERISGHIRDMDKNGFTVQIPGTERRIMTADIAMVEFTAGGRAPTADERERLRQGRQLAILKGGTALVGSIVEYERTMGGALAGLPKDHAFRIRFQIENGAERSFLSSDIARLYFKDIAAEATAGTAGQAPVTSGGVTKLEVDAARQWTDTGLVVRPGEVLRFEASGQVQLSSDPNDVAHSGGSLTGRYATGAPLPRALAGALIGRIDNGQPFAIGNQTTVTMPAAGRLFIGINDDHVEDNSGQFVLTIERQTVRRR